MGGWHTWAKVGAGLVFLACLVGVAKVDLTLTELPFPLAIRSANVLEIERERLLRTLVHNAMLKVNETRNFIHSADQAQAQFTSRLTMADRHAVQLALGHQFPCLWTESKEPSVVDVWDGAKYTCGLQQLAHRAKDKSTSKKCIVYSFGSFGNSLFEETVKRLAKDACEIHTFDPTVHDKKVIAELGKWTVFHEYGLMDHDDPNPDFPVKTLKSIMAELGHDHIDILKIDIESSEFSVFKSWDWMTLPVGQVLVEIHWRLEDKLTDVWELLGQLHQAGYFIFNTEPNTGHNGDHLGLNELALVHWKWSPEMPPPPSGFGGLPKD